MKRRVPQALHHELSEYAALLRALRVRDALDVTKHLTKPSPFALKDGDLNTNTLDDEDDSLSDFSLPSPSPSPSVSASASTLGTPVPGPSDLNHPANAKLKSGKAKGKQPATPPRKQKRRDHWTRWPLLVDDVLTPEWSLEDEVAVIASQVLKSRPALSFPVSPVDEDGLDEEEEFDEDDDDRPIPGRAETTESDDPDHPYYVPYLTSIIANFLSVILATLASQTPARPASMQNRIEPLNWRAVIDAVVSCGVPEFSNAKVVENVIKRMEVIYGPSILPIEGEEATSFRAVERMKAKEAAAEKFAKVMKQRLDELFAPPNIPAPRTPSPPPAAPKLSRKARKEETDYVPRKRWTPKDKGKNKRLKRASEKKGPEGTQASNGGNDRIHSENEPEQPVRRSKRPRISKSYVEIPPEDIGAP